MLKKILKTVLSAIYRLLLRPSIRYVFPITVDRYPLLGYGDREKIFFYAMEFAAGGEKLGGDYLEFGVGNGGSFFIAFHFEKKIGKMNSMKFYAFDSFRGLPEPKEIDLEEKIFKKGEYMCSEDEFLENIRKNGVDLNRVITVPGWYKEVLNKETKDKLQIQRAAVVFIDCDLYESANLVLNFITDYLVDGSVLIFDDWFCFRGNSNKGEQKAFGEWLRKNP